MFNMSDSFIIEEDGFKFAIVSVKYHIIKNKLEAEKVQKEYSSALPDIPIILMAMGINGVPEYYGQEDIVNYIRNNPTRSPWKLYKLK